MVTFAVNFFFLKKVCFCFGVFCLAVTSPPGGYLQTAMEGNSIQNQINNGKDTT